MQITFSKIPDIPKGGQSIPIAVQLEYSPYNNIDLLFSLSTFSTGISMLPIKMEFKPGDTLGYYRIFVTEFTQASSSQITVSLLGSNADIYTISKSTLQFKLFANDTVLPDVTSIAITQIFRATASVVITTNKVIIVYYAVAGYGTIPPSFKELEQGGPPSYNTNEIQYGVAYINTSLVINVTISNLSAQKSYTIFAIAADQMLQTSLLVRIANFTTLPRYSPAIISLWFTQTYLTSVETSIAYNPWQVQEVSTASCKLSSATDNVVTLLQLYLIDNPSSDFYPRPVQLIDMLQAQISYLNESLNNFNSSAGIVGQEVVLSECSYYSSPMLLGTTNYQSISLEAALVEGGICMGSRCRAIMIREYLCRIRSPRGLMRRIDLPIRIGRW